jgi:hypothetical protein
MTTIFSHFPKRTALRVGYEQCLDDYAIESVIKTEIGVGAIFSGLILIQVVLNGLKLSWLGQLK